MLRPQEAEPSKVQNVRKLRNANATKMGQKNPENSPWTAGAELRPKRRPARNVWFDPGLNPGRAGNVWFNPGSNLGPHPPRVGDRPQKTVNRELPEKLLNTTERRQRKKVAQRERGSDEPKSS